MKIVIGFLCLSWTLTLSTTATFAACSRANGETYCSHTSDGGGQSYKPSSFRVTTAGHGARTANTNAERAVQAAQRRRQHIY
jgi:hypothetical protein